MIDTTELNVRLANREDAVPVSDLLHRLGLNLPSQSEIDKINSHWNRLWKENPFYKYYNEEILYGWVMVHKNRIVGFFGCIPRNYYMNSELFPVAIASQWGVEKEYREYTYLLCDAFFNSNPISTKLVTTAIKPTGRIFEKYNGHRVPNHSLQTVYMIPINLYKLLVYKYKEHTNKYPLLKFILRIFIFIIPWKLQYQLICKDNNFNEVSVNSLSEDIESFWQKYIHINRGLFASRSLDNLKWYYNGGNSASSKKIFIYTSNNQKIIGYASIIDQPVKDNKVLKRYTIIDLLAENKKIKEKILKGLIKYSYDNDVDVLEVHLPGMIERKDIPAIIIDRQVPQFPVFYQSSDDGINNLLQNNENWHISPYDGDTCLG